MTQDDVRERSDAKVAPAKGWRNKWWVGVEGRRADLTPARGIFLSATRYPSKDAAETRAAEILRQKRADGVDCEYLGAFPDDET